MCAIAILSYITVRRRERESEGNNSRTTDINSVAILAIRHGKRHQRRPDLRLRRLQRLQKTEAKKAEATKEKAIETPHGSTLGSPYLEKEAKRR